MKKKNIIASLVLAGALCFTSVAGVFAATTFDGVNEAEVEKTTYTFMDQVKAGKYQKVDTATLKTWKDKNEKMIILDTMPKGNFDKEHIPGAINAVAAEEKTMKNFTAAEKKAMLDTVNAKLPKKTVTKTTWSKVSKKTYSKLKKSMRKTKKVKKGKKKVTYYYKKVVKKSQVVDKSYKIVVYCGFIKCIRSHYGAAYLTSQGYTNVYRYGGGISAWKDAGNSVEATQAQ